MAKGKGTRDDPFQIQCSEASGQPVRYFASHCGATISMEQTGVPTTCPACGQWVLILAPLRSFPPPSR